MKSMSINSRTKPVDNSIGLATVLCFLTSLSLLIVFGAKKVSGSTEYLYKDNPSASHVFEYIASEGDNSIIPDFLASPHNGNRVVVFYAHWCGHCIHFAPQYMEMAKVSYSNNEDVKYYAVSCVPNRELCKQFNVNAFPDVKIFKSNSVEPIKINVRPILSGQTTMADEFLKTDEERKRISENLPYLIKNGKKNAIREKKNLAPTVEERTANMNLRKRQKTDTMNDASQSFFFSLRNSIYTSNAPLDDKKKDAFTDWLHLLSISVPKRTKIHILNKELIQNLPDVLKNEKNLINTVNKYDRGNSLWTTSCSKGVSKAGYTCGLWELFHMISIGLLEQNKRNENEYEGVSALFAANTIRNFIAEFFGCSECVEHFLSIYDSCWNNWCKKLSNDSGLNTKSVVLWLWDVHNDVNVRLMKESAERESVEYSDADKIKAQWPSEKECKECWNTDRSYNSDAVINYLKEVYWPTPVMPVEKITRTEVLVTEEHKTQQTILNILIACICLWLITTWGLFLGVKRIYNERCKTN